VAQADIDALLAWEEGTAPPHSIPFHPARVLMQDFTGCPASWISRLCATPWRLAE
jgi:aconitase A